MVMKFTLIKKARRLLFDFYLDWGKMHVIGLQIFHFNFKSKYTMAVILQLYLDYLCISIGFYKNLRDGYRFENVVYNEGSSVFVYYHRENTPKIPQFKKKNTFYLSKFILWTSSFCFIRLYWKKKQKKASLNKCLLKRRVIKKLLIYFQCLSHMLFKRIFLGFIFAAAPILQLCVCLTICLCVCLSVCLSDYLSVCLCICVYVFVSVYMFLVGVKYIYNLSNDLICLVLFKDLVEFMEYFINFILSFLYRLVNTILDCKFCWL